MKLNWFKRVKRDSLSFVFLAILVSVVVGMAYVSYMIYSSQNGNESSGVMQFLIEVLAPVLAVVLAMLFAISWGMSKTMTVIDNWSNNLRNSPWHTRLRQFLPILAIFGPFLAYKSYFGYALGGGDLICAFWLMMCLCTKTAINDTFKFFSARKLSSNIICLMLTYIIIDVISTIVSGMPSGGSACQQLVNNAHKSTWLEGVIKDLIPIDKAYLCSAVPNMISGALVALLGAGFGLYPIIQKLPEKREQWIKQMTLVNSLNPSNDEVLLISQKDCSVQLHKLAFLGLWILAFLGVGVFASTAFGLGTSLKVLSLIIIYTFYTVAMVFEAHLTSPLLPESSSLKRAVSLVLKRQVNINSDTCITLTASTSENFMSIVGYLNEHMLNTKHYVISAGIVPDFPILLAIDYDVEKKEIKVAPLTESFKLQKSLISEFKLLLVHKLNALGRNKHLNKNELQVWFKSAVYKDALALTSQYYKKESYQIALAAYLTICADSVTDFLQPNWVWVAKHIPEDNMTIADLLTYLEIDKSTWPIIENVEVCGLENLYTSPEHCSELKVEPEKNVSE